MDRQADGHSFNFASLHEKRIVNIEVSPDIATGKTLSYVTEVPVGESLFHANSILFLDGVEDAPSASSAHRLARVKQLPVPKSVEDVLTVLGDTADADFPIYRTSNALTALQGGDSAYTLITALFALSFSSGKRDEWSGFGFEGITH